MVQARQDEGGRCILARALGTGNKQLDYGPRSDRCEGIYARQVSTAIQMRVVGFQKGRGPSTPFQQRQTVSVSAPGGGLGPLVLRATAIPPSINYGMDTRRIGPDGTFAWDTNILGDPQLSLSPDQLALVACTNDCRPGEATIYLPVELKRPAASATERYVVTLVARRDLSGLTYSLVQDGAVVLKGERKGPLFAEAPVRLNLGELKSGAFQLKVLARTAESQTESLQLRLLAPAAP